LQELLFDELRSHFQTRGFGGFIPAVMQLANVAALPGIVKA
jgi:tRNA-splicing ligase RtcB